MCYCTNLRAQQGRALTTAILKKALGTLVDTRTRLILEWIYGNNETTGRANSVKINHIPKEWRKNYDKTTPKNSYEQQQGLGAEIAMNMDNPMPIWSGIITKAHIQLLQNGAQCHKQK